MIHRISKDAILLLENVVDFDSCMRWPLSEGFSGQNHTIAPYSKSDPTQRRSLCSRPVNDIIA
jgi:hypothetical protein